MTISPTLRIHQAFLQLEFSLKLMSYFERGEIDQESFDRSITFKLPDGDLNYDRSAFNSYNDLILCAQNVYSTSLGVSAIALETALQEAGIQKDLRDPSSRSQLRCLIYQIRCAFAHDSMHPTWVVRGDFARPYEIVLNGVKHTIDLSMFDGEGFELEQIGGMHFYQALRDEVIVWLSQIQGQVAASAV